MPERKEQQLDISIIGSVDSSLAKAIGVTEAQLAKLKDAVNTINKGFSKEAFGGIGPAAQQGFEEAAQHANKFHDTMKRIGETMAGVFSAEVAMKFFDTAVQGAEKLIDALKEASNQAANFEQQSFELKTDVRMTPAQQRENELYLWQRSLFTPYQVPASLEAERLLSSSSAEIDPNKKMDIVRDRLRKLEDVAAVTAPHGATSEQLNEHLTSLAEGWSKIEKAGVILEKGFYMLENQGVLMRPWFEQKLGLLPEGVTAGTMEEALTPEQRAEIDATLAKMIRKRQVPAYLAEQFLTEKTGEGGTYYKGAAEAGKLTFGVESSFMDVINFMNIQVGNIINGPLKTLLTAINEGFAAQIPKLLQVFDDAANKSKLWADQLMAAWDKVDKSGVYKALAQLGDVLAQITGVKGILGAEAPKSVAEASREIDAKTASMADEMQKMVEKLEAIITLLADLGKVVQGIETMIGWLSKIDDVLFSWLPKIFQGLTPVPLSDKDRQEIATDVAQRVAKGGHEGTEAPKRSNYLNDADFQKALDIYNKKPHMAEGGVVTRATSLLAGESGPEAILPLLALRDHPLIGVIEELTDKIKANLEEKAIPALAEGGVVTRATSIVAGESGPEAILPLSVLQDSPVIKIFEESAKLHQATTQEQIKAEQVMSAERLKAEAATSETMVKLTESMGKLSESMATLQLNMAAGGMGGGMGSSYGGGGGMTEYGASVPGDQPGGPTYDWNSYHGIGAYTQHLVPGQDVAMHPDYARGHYHIAPLDFYVSDKDHLRHRWADVSGSKNPANEDLYRGALGGIFTRPTRALIGEAGPEALIPLGGAGGLVTLNYSPTIHGFGDIGGLLREHADELLKQVEHALSSRFSAMAAV